MRKGYFATDSKKISIRCRRGLRKAHSSFFGAASREGNNHELKIRTEYIVVELGTRIILLHAVDQVLFRVRETA